MIDNAIEIIRAEWPAIEAAILNDVTDWSVCVQAGGHHGLYPKNLAKMFNTVITFEADVDNYNLLKTNCVEKNIKSFNKALGAYNHRVGLTRSADANTGQNMVVDGDDVEAVTIDSLKLKSCGLIQLDIERHELFALMGAIETIQKFNPVIILEGPETTNNACNAILEQLGYQQTARAGYDSVFKHTGAVAPTTEYKDTNVKKILIAIPTARYIEADTFMSIYNLKIPDGYVADFQCFYGYRVDQVRNLIADWVVRGYDYLFSVDHDVTFAPDTLEKLLNHNKDAVAGVYRQRVPEQLIEIYDINHQRMRIEDIKSLTQIGACGFGCVLVKKQVFAKIGYPHFEYHPALDHSKTVSEDTDFCRKATNAGFTIWCDPSILCGHIGSTTMRVEVPQVINDAPKPNNKLFEIASQQHLPEALRNYTHSMDNKPKIIYDIGANAIEWGREAKKHWPDADVFAFEAMESFKPLYDTLGIPYYLGVLSDEDNKQLVFYENPDLPWGNSYYIENEKESPPGCSFNNSHAVTKNTMTLDTVVKSCGFPAPDMIKIDVQGAEMDILKGATETLKRCRDLIIELQHEEYNVGAPMKDEMFAFLESIGFELVTNIHTKKCDGDYHFSKKIVPTIAYIIHTSSKESLEWRLTAIESCKKIGLEYVLFSGFETETPDQLSDTLGIDFGNDYTHPAAARATASHFALWNHIEQRNECAIILEHDSVMKLPLDINIPDNTIVALGYKYNEQDLLKDVNSDDPIKLVDISKHSGAHAYCITSRTAETLLKELQQVGAKRAIDNFYFMRINDAGDTESSVPLSLTMPTAAVCIIRGSTIWEIPSTLNYELP